MTTYYFDQVNRTLTRIEDESPTLHGVTRASHFDVSRQICKRALTTVEKKTRQMTRLPVAQNALPAKPCIWAWLSYGIRKNLHGLDMGQAMHTVQRAYVMTIDIDALPFDLFETMTLAVCARRGSQLAVATSVWIVARSAVVYFSWATAHPFSIMKRKTVDNQRRAQHHDQNFRIFFK